MPENMLLPTDVHEADRGVLRALSVALDLSEAAVLARLVGAEGDPGVTVVAGRITSLDLRPLGSDLRFAAEDAALGLSFRDLTALERLDVSGLTLDTLDVVGLARLVELRCDDNRLRHLELDGCSGLRTLSCTGNELMVLDLVGQAALEDLDCSGNQLTALIFAPRSALRVLRCSRNELMVLSVQALTALEELACFRNVLVHLELGELPALRVLDVARNDLMELGLRHHPRLVELSCARNRLAELDLRGVGGLRHLDCVGNYIEELDVAGLGHLEVLHARGNQLARLSLGPSPALVELDCDDNRLEALDVSGCPLLEELRCAGNEIAHLEVSGCPELCLLDCAANSLKELDLRHNPGLAELSCGGNSLTELDIRPNRVLCRLSTGDERPPQVLATQTQRHRLAELRDRHGLGSGRTDIEGMSPWELHELAATYRGPDLEQRLLEVVRSPNCDLGTALMVYWTSAPHFYLQFAARGEVEGYQIIGWDLLEEIERRVEQGFYVRREIWFDPRNDKQTRSVRGHDWTQSDLPPGTAAPRRHIPAILMNPSKAHP